MLRFVIFALALMLPLAAQAQGYRSLTGSVTYRERIALPPDAVLVVEMVGPDLSVTAEARIPTEGRQVPVPFSIEIPEGAEGRLRAGLATGGQIAWLSDTVAIDINSGDDLGELVLRRHQPMGFASTYRCGDRLIRVGFAGEAAVMDTGEARLILQPVPAASGARYEAERDPGTFFWSHGDGARVSLEGTELAECRPGFPMDDGPYTAGGNEPFWQVMVADGQLLLSRPAAEDLAMPVRDSTLTDAGEILVTAADAEQALEVVLLRQAAICRDSMTGMPHPETVTLTLGEETLTGCGGAPVDLLIGRTWVVEDIGDAPVGGSAPTLDFGTEGRVAGGGGCNRWFAAYELTGEGLRIGEAGATLMACGQDAIAVERRFFDTLARVTGFDIDETGALLLRTGDGVAMTARAAPPE